MLLPSKVVFTSDGLALNGVTCKDPVGLKENSFEQKFSGQVRLSFAKEASVSGRTIRSNGSAGIFFQDGRIGRVWLHELFSW